MKKFIYKYSLIFSVICGVTLFNSCEKEIEVDLNSSEPKIVIEGKIKLDSVATVKITKSKDYNTDGIFPAVNDAIVTITDNNGNSEILKQNSEGLYYADTIKGIIGNTYYLSVSVENEVFTAASTMPEYVPIDSLYMYDIPAFDYAMPMVKLQDPEGIENYYRYVLYINGRHINYGYSVQDDDNRDGFPIERLLPVSKKDNGDNDIHKGDVIWVELQCIDKGVYTFFDTLGRISETLVNPTSNIKGGALGYFSAYTYDRKSIIAEW